MSRPTTPAPLSVSANIQQIQPSATIAVSTLCKTMRDEGREVIDLSAGEPDFRTPDFAAQAGIPSFRASPTIPRRRACPRFAN
jgi:aspartate aminotransferase